MRPLTGKGPLSPLPVEENENIFDRIRKIDLDNKQEDFIFDPNTGNSEINVLSPTFRLFNSSENHVGINQYKMTPEEVVSKLNDDTFLMSPFVNGEGFSQDDVYRYFTSFNSNDTFGAALTEITDQMKRLAIIDSLCSTMGHLQNVDIDIFELETSLSTAFNQRKITIWLNIPTAHILYSPTQKTRVEPNTGIVGKTAQNMKRRIISNPKESDWYNSETDSAFFESSVCVVCLPLLDPLTHQLIAIVSISSRTIWTEFDNLLLDHLETKLPPLLATLKISASKIRSILAIVYSATGNELKQRSLISNACQSLKSALNCEVAQIFFVDWQHGVLEFYAGGSGKKHRVPLRQGGIASFVAQEGEIVNIAIASEHPHFNKVLDDEYRSRSVIAAPMINESSPNHEIFGVAICRGKRGSTIFNQHDAILLGSLSAVTARTFSNFQRYRSEVLNLKRVLTAQDHYIELLTTAESLSSVIDKDQLFEMIMTRSRSLVSADRCSLFITDRKREYLLSKVAYGTSRSIVLPISQGIAGHVATTGQLLNIQDAYQDSRFNNEVDQSTGYRTKSILCLPIIGRAETIIGVTQMINKQGKEGVFTANDIDLMKAFNVFCGIALSNANLFDDTNTMKDRVEELLNLTMSMSREQSLPLIMEHIAESGIALINSERCVVFLIESDRTRLRSAGLISRDKLSSNVGIFKEVVNEKKIINIHDVTKDMRWDPSLDQHTPSFVTHNLLAAPIIDPKEGSSIGVVMLINKIPGYDGVVFSEDDEKVVTAMASFAGFAISKALLHTNVQSTSIFDLFNSKSEQIIASQKKVQIYEEEELFMQNPSVDTRITRSDRILQLVLYCFTYFNLLEKLKISQIVFYQLIMLLQAISSDLPYHNFHHSFDTIQSVFCLLKMTKEDRNLDDIELFALLLASLMHNLGVDDENEGSISLSQLPLNILFKNQSAKETAYAKYTIQILTNKKMCFIENFNQAEKQKFWNVFIQLILSAGIYKQDDFVQLWKSGDHSNMNLMRLFIKIANLSNVARPYNIAMKNAMLLRKEMKQLMQEEKIKYGIMPTKNMQNNLDEKIEVSELRFAEKYVMPLIEIAASKWKATDVLRQQLLDNMRRWKEATRQN
ncbi:GAF domain containing protein [Histomonas meleagridis]|uniref:GAF domain containing protein n=1 Tax=Histomonas meleagridis TaxID=135588 RepID=UPI0035596CC5|nr:GAF domain containing protein [Histomonas meleagridis]KAH0802119.1 GAF domain containing protein [Histomonas meleagridis]